MRVLILLMMLSCLYACSTTKVHLYTLGVDKTELARVESSLKAHDYKVHLVSAAPPLLVDKPTLAYSLMNSEADQVNRLILLMTNLGYKDMDVTALLKGNHSYTGNNIGLYLESYGPKNETAGIANFQGRTFLSLCPNGDGELTLNDDGSFYADLFFWNNEDDNEIHKTISGEWQEQNTGDSKNIILVTSDQKVAFTLRYFANKSEYGNSEGIALDHITTDSIFESCNFIYRELEMPKKYMHP